MKYTNALMILFKTSLNSFPKHLLIFIPIVFLQACGSDDENELKNTEDPLVVEGRRWEDGRFFAYNASVFEENDPEYALNIIGDSVIYRVSDLNTLIWRFRYSGDSLYLTGNNYNNIDSSPIPTDYYVNRICSPGYILDYNDTTFLGFFNYQKISGNPGEIEGDYRQFLIRIGKKTEESEESRLEVLNQVLKISSEFDSDSLVLDYVFPEEPVANYTRRIHKDRIRNRFILLVRLDGVEYLFSRRGSGFYPGLICYLE